MLGQHLWHTWQKSKDTLSANDYLDTLSKHQEIFKAFGADYDKTLEKSIKSITETIVEQGYMSFLDGQNIDFKQLMKYRI